MYAETGNPCRLHRGEEGGIQCTRSVGSPWGRGLILSPGAVWGTVCVGLAEALGAVEPPAAGPAGRAARSCCSDLSLEIHGSGAAREGGEAQLGRRDQLLFLLSKTCEYILVQVRGLDPYPLKLI